MIGEGDGVVFDWQPSLGSVAELMTAPRGTDPRLDLNPRRTTSQRRERYHERMDAKSDARAELETERIAAKSTQIGLGRRGAGVTAFTRADIPTARRIVVKVGSSSISGENVGKIPPIVDALAEAHGRGTEVVLVSSGRHRDRHAVPAPR